MCIIFLPPICPNESRLATPEQPNLVLISLLTNQPDIGLCVDPTSFSPIHCTKLQVRHKEDCAWYLPCSWCTELARKWREGQPNDCEWRDRKVAEERRESEAAEEEILKRERVLAEGSRNGSSNILGRMKRHGHGHGGQEVEKKAMTMWNGSCCACE